MRFVLLACSLFLCLGSVSPGADDALLLSDDFSKLDSAWGDADGVQSVSGNHLLVAPKASTSYTSFREGNLFGDADIRIKVSLTKGNAEKPGGIAFWGVDYNNYYVLQIFADGHVRVAKRTPTQWLYPVTNKVFDAAKKGVGQVNELRIVTSGNQATVYVNDKAFATFKGFPPTAGGKIGVFGTSANDVCSWAFSELNVRKPSAAEVVKVPTPPGNDIIFTDDFSTLDPGWGDADGVQSVAGNKLLVAPKVNSSYSTMYEGNLFGDADIRIKVSLTKGGAGQSAGIIFWATDYDNYYSTQLFSNGTFGVARVSQGHLLQPVPQQAQDAPKKGPGEVNELRLVTRGNSASAYINDKLVAAFKGFPPKAGGKIGVSAGSTAEPYAWAFSELAVRKLPATTVATAALPDDMIFAEDFSTLDPAWDDGAGMLSVSDNQLLLTPKPNTTYLSLYNGALFKDADIRLTVSLSKGGDAEPAAIAFWAANYQNCYLAQIYSDGTFGVSRRIEGKSVIPIQGVVVDAVKKGIGQENQFRVVTQGNLVTIYLNDKQISAFRGYPPEAGSKIGLYAASSTEAYGWRLSKLTVRKAPALTVASQSAPADSTLIFADDFSMLDPTWGDADRMLSVSANQLLLTPKPGTSYLALYNGNLFKDADVRVNISLTKGGGTEPVAIAFWATDYKNYYLAQVYSDGTFGVSRKMNGKSVIPVQGAVLDVVKKGIGQENELRVLTQGNLVTVYVNNKQVTAFRGFPPDGGGKIGLYAGSGKEAYDWTFSKLTVLRAPALTVAGQTTPPRATDPAVIVADDFSTLDPAWGDVDDIQSVAGNKLVMSPKPNTAYTSLYCGSLFDDADTRVKVSLSKGGVEKSAGVVFWAADFDNYYVARVYANGVTSVAHRSQGKWSYPTSMKVYGAVNEGAGQTNVLRVVTSGRLATVYVNDRKITSLQDTPPAGGSRIGLQAESAADSYTWTFSELTVRKVPMATDSVFQGDPAQPLPKEIVTAWVDAGATAGWIRNNEFGIPIFVSDRLAASVRTPGDLPAFDFSLLSETSQLAKLPVPTSAFGLTMLYSSPAGQGLNNLARFNTLQTLVFLSPSGSDAALKGLGNIKSLRTLQILGQQMTDVGMKELAGLQNLQTLTLGCPRVTNLGLKELAGLTNLQTLNASGNQLTDAGLKSLAGLKNLQLLNIFGTKVTDAGLKDIAVLKSLQSLNVGNTKVTAAGLNSLQKELPACRILVQ